MNQYKIISEFIEFVQDRFHKTNVQELALHLNMNSSEMDLLFQDWAGVTAEKLIQLINFQYFKSKLEKFQPTLFEDFQSLKSQQKHSQWIKIERMSAEDQNQLRINYHFYESPFGDIMIASTLKGICSVEFIEDEKVAKNNLKLKFPKSKIEQEQDCHQKLASSFFKGNFGYETIIQLHIHGTDFQHKVWEILLDIPMGNLTTYLKIAEEMNNRLSARAVGHAIGSNPVAFLIPCHRVVQSNGNISGYMWGKTRKTAILAWEFAKNK